MRKVTQLVLVMAGAAPLAACGSGGIANRERPDEFARALAACLDLERFEPRVDAAVPGAAA